MNKQEYSDRCTVELAKAIAENHKLKEKLRVAVEALEYMLDDGYLGTIEDRNYFCRSALNEYRGGKDE